MRSHPVLIEELESNYARTCTNTHGHKQSGSISLTSEYSADKYLYLMALKGSILISKH